MDKFNHYPVMYREVLDLLGVENKKIVVDCTVGVGAHASKILERMGKDGHLIGIDRDSESLRLAAQALSEFKGRFTLVKSDFANLDKVLNNLKIAQVDAFLFDLGISMYQLCNPERGFSFTQEGPLDMRMDRESFLSAADLITNLSEDELGDIFKKFGQERHARRLAHYIVVARSKQPISTTVDLADIVMRAVGNYRIGRIHPATRIFQALRIAVNRELEQLGLGLRKAVSFLNPEGRIGVICFHSLEDAIAKHTFREMAANDTLRIVTKKPVFPQEVELNENKASRSAKLRVAVKI